MSIGKKTAAMRNLDVMFFTSAIAAAEAAQVEQ